jgi:xanthine dehydrogenase accessory factor
MPMERTRSIYPEVRERLEKGEPLALATIIETSGSTPQIPGASALFGAAGLILGTLGGGVLEGEAGRRAGVCLRNTRSLFFRFELRGQDLAQEEPVCGGEASVLIDGVPGSHLEVLRAMAESLGARRRGVLATLASVGPAGEADIRRFWLEEGQGQTSPPGLGAPFGVDEIRKAASGGEPVVLWPAKNGEPPAEFCFLEPLAPLPRLVVAGAGHIGRAVARLAARLDFEVTVVDDRPDYVSVERFPEADRLLVGSPGPALREFPIDEDTYIVIVTRGHRDDADALRASIRSPAAYIGMIGSRSKISLTRERFIREGWASAEEFDRVHSPIGLSIGSRTVEEIAVSIAAELVQVRSRRSPQTGPAGK